MKTHLPAAILDSKDTITRRKWVRDYSSRQLSNIMASYASRFTIMRHPQAHNLLSYGSFMFSSLYLFSSFLFPLIPSFFQAGLSCSDKISAKHEILQQEEIKRSKHHDVKHMESGGKAPFIHGLDTRWR
jgi:hypothetical protein